jgi:hypothetical protein
MKKFYLVLLLSMAASAWAGDPPTPIPSQTNTPAPAQESVPAQTSPKNDEKSTTQIELFAREMPLTMERHVQNEITLRGIDLDGSLVQLATTDNPLQLINPAAPDRYGSMEDNLVRDSTSGRASGLKFLELRF